MKKTLLLILNICILSMEAMEHQNPLPSGTLMKRICIDKQKLDVFFKTVRTIWIELKMKVDDIYSGLYSDSATYSNGDETDYLSGLIDIL